MKREDFKKGIKFYVNGTYRHFYKVYSSLDGVLFIKKGGSHQGDVIAIMNDGIHLLTHVLEHPTDTFIPFSAMELIIDEKLYERI